jgi:alkylhydroperoxidase family enzyme
MASAIGQGPWTRVRPLQIDEVDDYTAAAYRHAEATWGHHLNNLVKTMGHCPLLAITEVPYANSFIHDVDVFNNGRLHAGFLERPLKELCINRTSLFNRSLFSVTHHTYGAYTLFKGIGLEAEGHRKLLFLHEHEQHRDAYTARENACLGYTVQVCRDAHEVTDAEFDALKGLLEQYNRGEAPSEETTSFDRAFIEKWRDYSDDQHAALVDSQLVELTWLIGQFCLLNRWFTALQVPNETAEDDFDFVSVYETGVPEDIRRRNDAVLAGAF